MQEGELSAFAVSGEALRVGVRVQLRDLVGKPELNGCVGTICGGPAESTGRFAVRVVDEVKQMSIKPANLQPIVCDRTFAPVGPIESISCLDGDCLAALTASFNSMGDWAAWRATCHRFDKEACSMRDILSKLDVRELASALRHLLARSTCQDRSLTDGVVAAIQLLSSPPPRQGAKPPRQLQRDFADAGVRSLAREILRSSNASLGSKSAACNLLEWLQPEDAGMAFEGEAPEWSQVEEWSQVGEMGAFAGRVTEMASMCSDEFTATEAMLGEWTFSDDAMQEDREKRLDLQAALVPLFAYDWSENHLKYLLGFLASSIQGDGMLAFRRKGVLVHGHDFGFGFMMTDPRPKAEQQAETGTCAMERVMAMVAKAMNHVEEHDDKGLYSYDFIALFTRFVRAFLGDTVDTFPPEDPLWNSLGFMKSGFMFSLSLMRRGLASDTGVCSALVKAIEAFPHDVNVVVHAAKSMWILIEGRQDEKPPQGATFRGVGDRAALLRKRMATAAESGVVRALFSALVHDSIRRHAPACIACHAVLIAFVGMPVGHGTVDCGGSLPGGSDSAFLASIALAVHEKATFVTIAKLLDSCPVMQADADFGQQTMNWLKVSVASALLWLLTAPCFEWGIKGRQLARDARLDVRLVSIVAGFEYGSNHDEIAKGFAVKSMLRLCANVFDSDAMPASLATGDRSSRLKPPPELASTIGLALLRKALA